jgi:hypothetical protein
VGRLAYVPVAGAGRGDLKPIGQSFALEQLAKYGFGHR